jgi:hypothetical protein
MPVTDRFSLRLKGDQLTEDQGLENRAIELDADVQVTEDWIISAGVRNESRTDSSPVVPLTQEQGDRTDAVVQATYDPETTWTAYGYAQETLSASETREDNGRIGAGGSYRFTERFEVDGEISQGDLGPGGKIGTSWLYTDRTNLYLTYALENERQDNGLRARQGTFVSGVKHRLSDSSSVYVEDRYESGGLTGLTHATGVNLVAHQRWNISGSAEWGTLIDAFNGAQTDRMAAGFRLGYGVEKVQFSTGVEYRKDDAEQPDATEIERTVWLFRNDFKFQMTPNWRLLGKVNHSFSDSSLGDFFGGGYTEAVFGYAYRPVRNDRLSALAKYTYFYNMPTTGQDGAQGSAAEFIQKSHIAAFDLNYDLTAKWTIGGKYAYRLGQVSLERDDPEFFDNAAQLVALRVDWRFFRKWESMAEFRVLDLPDLDQRRSGALVAVYRYIGKYLKVGAGYNFTDFSDDLTDLSYDHQGVFINFIGSM